MKTFVVHLSGKQSELMNDALLETHVEYLRTLSKKNHLRLCGPCTDDTAIIVLDAETQELAQEMLDGDPFSAANYYSERRIVELVEASPGNNFLLGWSRDKMAAKQ